MSSTTPLPADATYLERDYPAAPERIWQLWTTADGIEQWWAPDGFRVTVTEIDARPGGTLRYDMSAVGEQQIAFMEQHGLPLTAPSTKTFTEVEPTVRLGYSTLIDFVPDHAPYEVLTIVELTATTGGGTHVRMGVERMHDDTWNGRLIAGRGMELDALGQLLAG